MKYELRYLPEAELDLMIIDDYLSQFYPGTPGRFFSEYDKAVQALLKMPMKYILYPDTKEFHRMIVRDFLVFYKVNESERIVTIHRVLHGAQDITTRI